MKLSPQGRALIKGFEGLSLKAYPDTKKGYSIGYGHFGASPGDVITQAEADRLFDVDAVKYEAAVSYTTPTALPHEFDAMVSLAYNIGPGDVQGGKRGFAGSTVARMHVMGNTQAAADAFRLWNKSDEGKGLAVNPNLVKRREKERDIYLHGHGGSNSYPPAAPAAPSTPSTPQGWPGGITNASPLPYPTAVVPTATAAIAGVSTFVLAAAGWFLYRLLHR
jgi:lysozyme